MFVLLAFGPAFGQPDSMCALADRLLMVLHFASSSCHCIQLSFGEGGFIRSCCGITGSMDSSPPPTKNRNAAIMMSAATARISISVLKGLGLHSGGVWPLARSFSRAMDSCFACRWDFCPGTRGGILGSLHYPNGRLAGTRLVLPRPIAGADMHDMLTGTPASAGSDREGPVAQQAERPADCRGKDRAAAKSKPPRNCSR
jgi:hypothetical protein